jgi:hypothetical protein
MEAGEGAEGLEFGYCWDVAIRAFVPIWVFLYVVQFLCMPAVATDHWYVAPFYTFPILDSLISGNSGAND